MSRGTRSAMTFLDRAITMGSLPTDDAETRLRRSALLLTMWSVALLAPVWVLLYLLLDRPLSAAIPLGYELITLASLAWVAWRGWSDRIRLSQPLLMLVLPALLMWSLGGFVPGSAVIVWAFLAPVGALVFADRRTATAAFLAFVALVIVSGLMDPWLARQAVPLPATVIRIFFVLNIVAVGSVAFGVMVYFVYQREQALRAVAAAHDALDLERARSEALLHDILPDSVADRLKDGQVVADRYEAVSVLFADVVGFTPLAAEMEPEALVALLDKVYGGLDDLAAEHGLVRIKTMGDAYMAAAGVPEPVPARDGALAAVGMGLAMIERLAATAPDITIRVGIHTGPAVAGVIGRRSFAYDLWGDAVNIGSRMESHGIAGQVQVSPATYALVQDRYPGRRREPIEVKGVGRMAPFLLDPAPGPAS